MTSTLLPILPAVDDVLFDFAQSDGFWANLAIAFGANYDVVKATELQQQWKSRNFSQIPPIEVLSDEVLGTANGAYSSSTNKIYLSASFLNTASSAAIVNVILEEIGHYVDAQINQVDSAGDEGAIFAELVQGNSLDVATLDALRAENDQTTIIVNGESIQVEQANFTGTNGNDTITGTSGDDTISPLRGQDNVNGGDGNDLLIVNYSSNTYAGTTTYPAGMSSSIYWSGGAWSGSFSAYINSSGNYDYVNFSNIERFQITGTNADDYFDRGGYGVFNIDGGTGTDTIGTLDLSSFTTNLTIDNSGGTFTESNGNVVKNVERFNNLTTGTGNDSISFTGSFNETIATGEGDDTISAARGQDNVNGGDGNDLLIVNYSSNTYAGTTTYPAGMNSSIYQSGGAWSGSFSAYINSSGNYDYLSFSNIERFQITGTNANDYFDRGGYGVFNIDGGTGTDTIGTLDLSSFTTNLTIDNSGGTFTESNGNVVKNVERFNNLTTGTGNDSISFTGSFNETIATGEGDDTINGGRGQDNVNGGDGNDLLIVNYSSNTYAGTTAYPAGMSSSIYWSGGAWSGSFSAYINSSGNYDYVNFSNIERFQITGTNADDYFDRGGYGVFNIDGGTGTDTIGTLDLSSFTTNLTIDNSGGTFTESNGNVVKNVERFNNLTTGTGNDSITFTGSFNETIATGEGDDTISAARGQDNVNGGDGNDLLIVNYSSNTYAGTTTYPAGMSSSIYWSGGAWSGSFSAYINSSGNYDYLSFSNIERFQITGTNANDYFDEGGYGVFNIDGGTGTDTIGTLDLSSFTTNLTIDNSGGTFTESNGNVVKNVERFNNLTTGTGNDSISFTGSFNETIATGEGNDTINGGRGQDNVNGGDGNDLLIVNYSSNTYAGTTTYPAGMNSSIYQSGGAWSGSFSAYINSSGNTDYVDFSNIERFQITGTNANDTITTGGGNDIITGVNPNSSTPGKGEIDSLTGGAGSDRFILGDATWIGYDDGNTTNAGTSDYATIADFNTTDDTIQLRGASSDYLLTVSGSNTKLYINKPGTEPDELIAVINNQTALSLTASYFSYVASPTLPSITLAVSPSSVTEDGTTNLVYTFTRTGVTTNALTVNYTLGGTATLNTDYTRTGTTNTVTFAAGSSTATVTVDPTADTTVEPDETVILTLASGTGYTVGTTTPVTGTITNDDFPSITLAVSPSSVTEDGTTNLVYTFTRTGSTTSALTANYTVTGTATNGTDYTSIPTSVTFAAGSSTATVTVDPTADTTVEPDETVILTLASGTGYTVGTPNAATGTITNDDFPSITLAVSPSSVTEDGTTNLVYTFTRTGSTTSALTANYTVGGTATNGTDYTSIPTSVTFAAGSATATVTVDPTADTTVESDETVILTLASGTGYTVGTTTPVTGTITNSPVTPSITLAVSPSTVTEDGTTNLVYTFTRTGSTTSALTANYTVGG
ncbi:Calx-beta domain-containing protein, partial [Microcystis sp. 0824]|uniref:beta strand repeat-containing protein n=1 Tax=Microcystis sp. 0824 TaxID=1502726 RepID=UPI0013048D88